MAHIAMIIPSLVGGGAERSVLTLAVGLGNRGHRVDIVLFSPMVEYCLELPGSVRLFTVQDRPSPEGTRLEDEAMTVISGTTPVWRVLVLLVGLVLKAVGGSRLSRTSLSMMRYIMCRKHPRRRVLRLTRYFDMHSPGIVFANLPKAEIVSFVSGELAKCNPPVVPTLRMSERYFRERRGWRARRERRKRLLERSPHIVTVSNGVAKEYSATLDICSDRITPIYNPVVTPHIARDAREEPDHPWLVDGGPDVILGAGRLDRQKDFGTLIESFRQVAAQRPCRLVILGKGPMLQELEDLALALGVSRDVSLPGWSSNPFAIMARARLFVLSSRYEGLPGVLIQALASGCPAVATDCPSGPAEILEDPNLLAPVGDSRALAQVMLRALAEPVDREAVQARASRFSEEHCLDEYERLIEVVLARHRSTGRD